jgi:hypothetical protein
MGIEAIIALGGLVLPPLVDLFKKIFVKGGKDTPEATMSTLATTKPEVLADYVNSLAVHLKAQVEFFNRDIAGQKLPEWVSAFRGMIKPGVIVIGIIHLSLWGIFGKVVPIDAGVKLFYIAIISAWFGTSMTKD